MLRGGAIGDFIVTLPVFQALRRAWPRAYIEVVGYPHIAQLALACGLVNAVTSMNKAEMARLFSLKPSIPEEQARYLRSFGLILSYLYDPGNTVRENLLGVGVRQVVYGSPQVGGMPAVSHMLKPLESLAIYPEEPEYPRLDLDDDTRARGRERLKRLGERVVAIHPGSGSPKKNWPLDRFLSAGRAVRANTGASVCLILGDADDAIAGELKRGTGEFPVVTGCSLVDLAGILAACDGYLGNDSGITHMAAAVGIPTVALFGPTDPAIWGPRAERVAILTPASERVGDLAEIPVDAVLRALQAMMPF